MTPSIFISYSWDDDTHKEWVRKLAKRLRQDGVDVTLDRWATAPGDQLSTFMERAIRENQFILIICTPGYKSRSDERKGGVGYEGSIMTAEAMTTQNDRKFIPILRKGTWDEAAPSWLKGKYYINLSSNPYSEQNYEELVRTLLGNRETAPPIGEPMGTISHTDRSGSKQPDDMALSQDSLEDERITKIIDQAVFLQQQDKRDEAIKKWRTIAQIVEGIDNDLAARAWFSVGYLLENPEDRILSYDRAISLKLDFVEAYNNRGNAKVEQDRYKEAIVDYDEAIRLKSDFADAYHNRGIAKGKLDHHEDSIADFDEAIRLKSDFAEAYYNRGIAKGKLGHHEDAITDYDEAIRLKPDSAEAYYSRGSAKDSLSHYEDAIADYDEAIRLKPDYTDAYHNRGIAKGRLDHYEDAIADYDEAIRLESDSAEAYYYRGGAKATLEQYDEAIADYDEAIRLKSDYADAYYNRGNAKATLEQYDEAIADYDEAIRLKSDYADAYYNRGNAKALELRRSLTMMKLFG